jgi:UDP-N-acetylmuramoylalanine--D-glutamate ligase
MKIAIAGYGAEGESNYRYWNTPDNQVVIIDEHEPARTVPVDASVIVGEDAYARLEGYDLVIRTAGLAPRKIITDGKIWSATNEFFARCPAPIIGVTGSKGKGTTSSLIANILRAAGRTVHLVGNIGVPALDTLAQITADDVVVYELSSFQLWDLEKSPHIAVVLMIEPDHLDVHADMDDYIEAKSNIRRYQTCDDICLYHPTNEFSRRIATVDTGIYSAESVSELNDTIARYGIRDDDQVYVENDAFMVSGIRICSTDALQLPGEHNIENACAAISAVLALNSVTSEAVESGLRAFSGLPHRLKLVRSVAGVGYYDDSIATTPGSAIAAIHAFSEPKVLILGGSDKGADYNQLVGEIVKSDSVRAVVAVGKTGESIAALLREQAPGPAVDYVASSEMRDFVHAAAAKAQPGDVVILSPASASFDMFKSYSDRGDQFVDAVVLLEGK